MEKKEKKPEKIMDFHLKVEFQRRKTKTLTSHLSVDLEIKGRIIEN